MTFDKLRVSIFEAYQNNEISRNTCEDMLESVLKMEGDHIVAEAENARTEFMGVAMEAAHGGVEFAAFEKKAATFGQKIANAWEKFKAWVKKIIDAIKSKLGFKKSIKIQISEAADKLMDQIIHLGNSIAANAGPKEIVAAIAAVSIAGIGIFKGTHKKTVDAEQSAKKGFKCAGIIHKLVEKFDKKKKDNAQQAPASADTNGQQPAAENGGDSTGQMMSKTRGILNWLNNSIASIRRSIGIAAGDAADAVSDAGERLSRKSMEAEYKRLFGKEVDPEMKNKDLWKAIKQKRGDYEDMMNNDNNMADYSYTYSDLTSGDSMMEMSDDLDNDDFDFESMLDDLDI